MRQRRSIVLLGAAALALLLGGCSDRRAVTAEHSSQPDPPVTGPAEPAPSEDPIIIDGANRQDRAKGSRPSPSPPPRRAAAARSPLLPRTVPDDTIAADTSPAAVADSGVPPVVAKPLDLKPGVTEIISLQSGTYLIDVTVKSADGSASGVTLTWDGARCANQPESQVHRMECVVDRTANLSITNPERVSDESVVTGLVRVIRKS